MKEEALHEQEIRFPTGGSGEKALFRPHLSGTAAFRREQEKIERYFPRLSNPFGGTVSFRLLALAQAPNARKLGTYGMIHGASDFIGVTAAPGGMDLEAVGYEFETLILYAASIGLGTCWLGGSFNRSEFAEAMGVRKGDLFPAVSPSASPPRKRT